MKKYIIDYLLKIIKEQKSYTTTELEEIRYGLSSIYLLISKLLVIFPLGYLLGLFNEMLIFMIIYNIIRMPSFGLHATKSWICLLVSTLTFIGIPYLSTAIVIPIELKILLGVITIALIYKNAPADTHKKPIVNPTRRRVYKIISVTIAILYVIIALLVNNFMSNMFLFSLMLQCFIISPFIYSIFNLPYDNYKTYLANNNILETS